MSDNTWHLAKRCVKDAGPCLALCVAGAAVALLAVLGPLHGSCRRHDDRRRARSVFWVLDPFGWKNEG